jgi:hypothetical protein
VCTHLCVASYKLFTIEVNLIVNRKEQSCARSYVSASYVIDIVIVSAELCHGGFLDVRVPLIFLLWYHSIESCPILHLGLEHRTQILINHKQEAISSTTVILWHDTTTTESCHVVIIIISKLSKTINP